MASNPSRKGKKVRATFVVLPHAVVMGPSPGTRGTASAAVPLVRTPLPRPSVEMAAPGPLLRRGAAHGASRRAGIGRASLVLLCCIVNAAAQRVLQIDVV